jgi:hypothetical protein
MQELGIDQRLALAGVFLAAAVVIGISSAIWRARFDDESGREGGTKRKAERRRLRREERKRVSEQWKRAIEERKRRGDEGADA